MNNLPLNYSNQMRAFEALLLKNPWRLSRSAQVLWNRLTSLADRQGGVWKITIAGESLTRLMGVTEKAFLAARAELEDQGLLECERGVKCSPSHYTLKRLYASEVNP